MPRGYEGEAVRSQEVLQLSSDAGVRLLQAYLGVPLWLVCIPWELCGGPVYPVEGCYVVQQQ